MMAERRSLGCDIFLFFWRTRTPCDYLTKIKMSEAMVLYGYKHGRKATIQVAIRDGIIEMMLLIFHQMYLETSS